ncbi:uncharacterized protein LOC142814729 [Rhipicephalus microplus]|uniref:uncharacterized protein LOC142814729 n=1 Tax=Rhipicephalus microplus TaxID=6941 RepID=UPI003F6B42AC
MVKPWYVSYDALLIPVQSYNETVPSCSRCGSVGHQSDACPSTKPDICGMYGKAVPLTDGARAPHECTPRCTLCAGPRVTGNRCCKERYRALPPKPHNAPSKGQAGPKKRKRRCPGKPQKSCSPGTAARGSAFYHQPCPVPAPWCGCSRAFPERPNSGRISRQGAYCGAGFARPAQTEPAVTRTQICWSGGFIVGHPRSAGTPGSSWMLLDQRC